MNLTLTSPKIKLNTTPEIVKSDYLNKISGLDLSILDYSCTDVGTHKLEKAKATVEYADNEGYSGILFINPVVDLRENSNGSGIDALELACAAYTPNVQAIGVVHSENPYVNIENINSNNFDSRKRLEVGINLCKFWKPERLEDLFNYWMSDTNITKDLVSNQVSQFLGNVNTKDLIDFKNSEDIQKLKSFLEKQGVNSKRFMAGTNLLDFCDEDNESVYQFTGDLKDRLNEFDYVVGSAGTGERALGQIRSLENPYHIIVVPNGHPLDPYHHYEESDSKRVQTLYKVKSHERLFQESIGKNIIFKSVGLFGGKKAKEMLFDKAVQEDGLNMKSSSDGAIALSILREAIEPNYKTNLKEGLRVFNTYNATQDGFESPYQTRIKSDSKVCIVNTGESNNSKIKEI